MVFRRLLLNKQKATGRHKRTKVNNAYSSWSEITAESPQGSILGPLLRNIVLNDLFLYPEETFLSNYADELPCTELAMG